MSRHILSPGALDDLNGIYDYTAKTWGVAQAERYARLLQAAIERVADDPTLGQPIDERTGFFRYIAEKHLILYAVEADAIRVVRVLHQRMDLPRRLG